MATRQALATATPNTRPRWSYYCDECHRSVEVIDTPTGPQFVMHADGGFPLTAEMDERIRRALASP